MTLNEYKSIEDLVTDESFLDYYYGKSELAVLAWTEWKEEQIERARLIHEAFLFLDRLSLKLDEDQKREKLKKLLSTISEKEKVKKPINREVQKFAVAASILAAGILCVFIYKSYFKSESPSLSKLEQSTQVRSLENNSLEGLTVYKLIDSSIIYLTKGSSLRLSPEFGLLNRELYLDGEASFIVHKNPLKPFRVYAGNSVTTAIGTAFTVRALKNEASIQVVLLEGKIQVKNIKINSPILELVHGQKILIQKESISEIEKILDTDEISLWKEGQRMSFKETPFSDVIKILSFEYNVPILGYDQSFLSTTKITAEFEKTTDLSTILEALAFANNFKFKAKNDTIYLTINKIK